MRGKWETLFPHVCMYFVCVWGVKIVGGENSGRMSFPRVPPGPSLNRPLAHDITAHDITAPVTMHLEDKLAIYA